MRKNNVFVQKEISTCGCCSIQSVVSFYGGYVPLNAVIEDTLTDKNGCNAYNMVCALKKYGFEAYGMKIDFDKIDRSLMPVIAHTIIDGLEHFLVIYEIKGDSIVTMDPRVGKKVYKRSEFLSLYTGHVIVAKKCGEIIKMEKSNSLKKVICDVIKKDMPKYFTLIIISLFIILLSLVYSFYIKLLENASNISSVTLLIILVILLKAVFSFLHSTLLNKVLASNDYKINKFLINHIFRLPIRVINNKRVGEITEKIIDTKYVSEFVITLLLNGTVDIVCTLLSIVIMASISLKITCIIGISFIVYSLISYLSSRKLYYKELEHIRSYNAYNGDLGEYLGGISSIKNLDKEDYFISKSVMSYSNYLNKRYSVSRFNSIIETFKSISLELGFIISMVIAFISLNDTFTIFDIFTLSNIYALASASLTNIVSLMPSYMHVLAIFRGISEFIDIEEEKSKKTRIDDFKGLKLNNLTYSYDYFKKILLNFNLEIKKGDKIIITGDSGCGKSTLAKCISGEIRNYDGNILLNGIDICDEPISYIRDNIVYIGQNETLFTDTIVNNITFGDKDDELFNSVIDASGVREIIDKRNLKENSIVLSNLENFSRGEKSRIFLARALYKKPKVLIIDETLANISWNYETKILNALLKMEDLTLIYITHRNRNKYFDKIINLRKDGSYEIIGN